MIKNRIAAVGTCIVIISALMIGCSAGDDSPKKTGGLTVLGWSSGMGSVNNTDLDKTRFSYSINLTNESLKDIYVKSVLPLVNESIKNRVLSDELAVEVDRNIKPDETAEVKGEIIVDTNGMTKMDIEELGSFITEIKISNEEILKLDFGGAEGVEVDNSKENAESAPNDVKSDSDLINSYNTEDLDMLLSLYSEDLDGAFAEGYGSNLLRLFKKTEPLLFIQKVSGLEKQSVEGVLALLASEASIEEGQEGVESIEITFEAILKDKPLPSKATYVVYEALAQIEYVKNRVE